MNRHLHSPTKLTEFARDFDEEPETVFSKIVNKLHNAYNTGYNTVNEIPSPGGDGQVPVALVPNLSTQVSVSSSRSDSTSVPCTSGIDVASLVSLESVNENLQGTEDRTMYNVLTRISNIVAAKKNVSTYCNVSFLCFGNVVGVFEFCLMA